MTPTQYILLGIGSAIAVFVYLIYKLVSRWWQRRRLNRSGAKMRPKATVPITPPAPPVAPVAPVAAVRQPHPLREPSPEAYSASATTPGTSGSKTRRLWPGEPGKVEEHVFTPDESLPYVEESGYRYGRMTPTLASLAPSTEAGRRDLQRSLVNAGDYSVQAWSNFSAKRYLGIVLPLLVFGLLLVVVPEAYEPWVMVGLIIGPLLGWALPGLAVRARAQERLHEIEIAMPDMLDLLNMCVSQGMTVPSAIGRVSQELRPVYPALSKELSIVTDQTRVGSFSQALTNFSRRVDVPDVHSFASLLIQTEQMGTSVSEALEDYSDGMRESLRQRADEKANSATFKLLFPTVLCLMPAVFLFLMGPAVVELNRFFAEGGLDALRAGSRFERTNEGQ